MYKFGFKPVQYNKRVKSQSTFKLNLNIYNDANGI